MQRDAAQSPIVIAWLMHASIQALQSMQSSTFTTACCGLCCVSVGTARFPDV